MKHTISSLVFALAVTSGMPAVAGGSGGGGGGDGLSSSGPSYDPAEEYQKGLEAIKAEKFKDAERALKRVVKVAPKDANTHYLLGLAHAGQDEHKSAAKSFSKVIKYDATNYDAHARLILAYRNNEKADKAAKAEATLMDAKATCANVCADAAKIDAAVAMISANDESASIPARFQQAAVETQDAMYLEAVRLINLGQYDAGLADLHQVAASVGPHPDVLTYLGFANRKLGNNETAFSYYSAALAIDPNHLSANEYLGEFYIEQGDLERAKAQLEKLNALCPFGCAQTVELKKWIDAAEA